MYRKPATPLTAGGVFNEAVRLYVESFRRCAPIAALGAIVSVAFDLLIIIYARSAGLPLTGIEALQTFGQPQVLALGLLQVVILLALFGALLAMQSAVAGGDERWSVLQSIRLGFGRLGRCVIGAVVASALVLLGCLLLVPGIYLSTALALWPVALYIENDGALQSLETSRGLIQGHWWHSSAVLAAALLVVALFSMLIGVVTGVLELTVGGTPAGEGLVQLISAVSDLISLPMPPAILLALYHDLRLRHTRGRPNLLP